MSQQVWRQLLGRLLTFDYDMGDGVSVTVRPNVPSAGKIRIWGRNVTGSGSSV